MTSKPFLQEHLRYGIDNQIFNLQLSDGPQKSSEFEVRGRDVAKSLNATRSQLIASMDGSYKLKDIKAVQ